MLELERSKLTPEERRWLGEERGGRLGGGTFYPRFILIEALVALLVIVALMILDQLIPLPTDKVADPTDNSYVPRPEWYFLFLFQMLKYFPGSLEVVAAVLVPALAVGYLVLLPFLDRSPSRRPSRRPVVVGLGVVGLGGIAVLTGLAMLADLKGAKPSLFFQQWRMALLVAIIVLNYLLTWALVSRRAPNQDPMVKTMVAGGVAALSVVAVATILIMSALAPGATAAGPQLSPGEKAFVENCASCHKYKGQGGDRGPDLTQGSKRDAAWLIGYIKNPQSIKPDSPMSPVRLSDQDLAAVVQFLVDAGKAAPAAPGPSGGAPVPGAGQPGSNSAAASIEAGRKIFSAKNCNYCHRLGGQGGIVGPDLSKEGARREARWLEHYLTEPNELMAATLKPKIDLSREDILALAQYLASLK